MSKLLDIACSTSRITSYYFSKVTCNSVVQTAKHLYGWLGHLASFCKNKGVDALCSLWCWTQLLTDMDGLLHRCCVCIHHP